MNIQNSLRLNIQNNTFSLPKPKLRGKIHCAAFLLTCFGLLLFLLSSYLYQFNLGILIYLISQMLQFGVSSFYHIPDWNPKTKLFLRYLDHSCIFLLISGTQTSVLLNNIPKTEMSFALMAIKLSWGISLIGISRFLVFSRLYDIFDLICYICHGLIILPFIKLMAHFDTFELIFVCLGGIFYIVGGIVYGMERPNPVPELIGYHEIFHIFTLLANTCFAIVITKDYVYSVIFEKIK
ncbi:hemolysin III family channel protein [Vittaforma corneae ATCC 50505]|uniref:Hemolysin III family channel protein n=1 Tax=Vittaforma corneae (strain ATCC 50505) TaxID=993615 RepID=L2GMG8_VITCO|nr:hemolysin III family channel protein [Vittaforma corneae ATCC 50505]ELA42041.1 hemolysin III family channel protein [Vittaforma corneae ATCC 50505]